MKFIRVDISIRDKNKRKLKFLQRCSTVDAKRLNYLYNLSLKSCWVVITEVAPWNKRQKVSYNVNVLFFTLEKHNNPIPRPLEMFQVLLSLYAKSTSSQWMAGQLLTESQEAHKNQDDHSVQEVAGVADGGHWSSGATSFLSTGERDFIFVSQQRTPLLKVRHVRLLFEESRHRAGRRSYDPTREITWL